MPVQDDRVWIAEHKASIAAAEQVAVTQNFQVHVPVQYDRDWIAEHKASIAAAEQVAVAQNFQVHWSR